MLSRREMLAGGVVGSFASGSFAAEQDREQTDRDVVRALQGIQRSLDSAFATATTSGSIAMLRRNFELFLRSNTKFPDFCDIGIGVFYDVYDWHIRNNQPIVVTRQADNRYTIQYMFTTLILRSEHEASFIGVAYDKG
jgi:hypothetical protein